MSFHAHNFCRQTHTRGRNFGRNFGQILGSAILGNAHRNRHVLRLGGLHHLLLVDQGGHLEERLFAHLVAMGAHKVVDGSHLGGQGAPDAGLARDWKRPAVRLARARRRHRGDAIVRVGGNRQRAASVPLGAAATKGGAGANIGTACGLGPVVILVVILQFVVLVHAFAPLFL